MLPSPGVLAEPSAEARTSGTGQTKQADGPEWLRNLLTVSGPSETVTLFRAAAQGTNCAPWHLDLDAEEAKLFAPMASVGPEARLLAKELREIIADQHNRVLNGWAGSGSCWLDLHRLVPVPPRILQLGEEDPAAQHWLRSHWGTLRPLRQVRVLPDTDRRLRRSAKVTFEFYAEDWSPWQALRRMRADWRDLVFVLKPDYGDG